MGIAGYRQLTEQELADINEVKAAGEKLDQLLGKLVGNKNYDGRWIAIGKTSLQQGLMAVTRGIARPTNF